MLIYLRNILEVLLQISLRLTEVSDARSAGVYILLFLMSLLLALFETNQIDILLVTDIFSDIYSLLADGGSPEIVHTCILKAVMVVRKID